MSEDAQITPQYIAGLLDGEGWIGFSKHPQKSCRLGYNFTPHVSVQMRNNDAVLECISKKYGGYFYPNTTRNSRANQNWSPISILQINWRKIEPFLTDILPFLHAKRKQAELMLSYFKEAYPRQKGQNGRFLGDQFLEKKVWYFNELRRLNADGKAIQPLELKIRQIKK